VKEGICDFFRPETDKQWQKQGKQISNTSLQWQASAHFV
jgi:hypothetical protein